MFFTGKEEFSLNFYLNSQVLFIHCPEISFRKQIAKERCKIKEIYEKSRKYLKLVQVIPNQNPKVKLKKFFFSPYVGINSQLSQETI